MTRGRRSKRSAAPSSATHVVLLLAVAAAAASLPAAHAITENQLLDEYPDYYIKDSLSSPTYVYPDDGQASTQSSISSKHHSLKPWATNSENCESQDSFGGFLSQYTGYCDATNMPFNSQIKTLFESLGTQSGTDLDTPQNVVVSQIWDRVARDSGTDLHDKPYKIEFTCPGDSTVKTVDLYLTAWTTNIGRRVEGLYQHDTSSTATKLEAGYLCTTSSECDAKTLADYAGNCTTGTTPQGESCQLTCPSGSTLPDGSTSQTLECASDATSLPDHKECFNRCTPTNFSSSDEFEYVDACVDMLHSSNCSVTCKTGYTLDGNVGTFLCNNGTVTQSYPSCMADCTVSVANGNCGTGSLAHNQSCEVICDSTHGLSSNAEATVTCTNGVPSAIPTCHELAPHTSASAVTLPAQGVISVRPKNFGKAAKRLIVTQTASNYLVIDYINIVDANGESLDWSTYTFVNAVANEADSDSYDKGTLRGESYSNEPWINDVETDMNAVNNDGFHSLHHFQSLIVTFKDGLYIDYLNYKIEYSIADRSPEGVVWTLEFEDGSTSIHNSVNHDVTKWNVYYNLPAIGYMPIKIDFDQFSGVSNGEVFTFEGMNIPYPFRTLDIQLQNGGNTRIAADGVLYTSSSLLSFAQDNSVTVSANADLLSVVRVDSQLAFGDAAVLCGDGIIHNGEACDDGNKYFGDGCDHDCRIQLRYECTPETLFENSVFKTNNVLSSCQLQGTVCGDGFIDNSAAFHTQQQYRRIPFSSMVSTIANVTDPDQCAVALPSTSCDVNTTTITFANDEAKDISQTIIYASVMPSVSLFTDAGCTQLDSVNSDGDLLTQYIVAKKDRGGGHFVMTELEIFCDGVQVPIDQLSMVGDAYASDGLTTVQNNMGDAEDQNEVASRLIDGITPATTGYTSLKNTRVVNEKTVQYGGDGGFQIYGSSGAPVKLVVKMQHACKVTGLNYWERYSNAASTYWHDNIIEGFATEQDVLTDNYQWFIDLNDIKINRGLHDGSDAQNPQELCYGGCAIPNLELSIPADASTTGARNWIKDKLTPAATKCVKVEGSQIHSIKLYEAVGHVEECDGGDWCDEITCQIKPDAYCKPRENPIPTLLFSAKRSLFQYNRMYSGMLMSVGEQYDHWPSLVASNTYAGVISPTNVSVVIGTELKSRIALSGYDVQPAGGKLLIGTRPTCFVSDGCPTGTWTAIIKLANTSTKIATFDIDNGRTIDLVYQHGDEVCPVAQVDEIWDGSNWVPNPDYNANCPQLKLVCSDALCDGTEKGATFRPNPQYETMVAVSFWNNYTAGLVDLSFGDATDTNSNDEAHYGFFWRVSSNSTASVYLTEIHVSNFEYLLMSAVYQGHRLVQGLLQSQMNHHDTYGAGLDCDDNNVRLGDGVYYEGSENCDDGNTVNGDGCDSNGVFTTATNWACTHPELWGSASVKKVTFENSAQIEEVQFFKSDGSQIKSFSPPANKLKLADGIWNTPGQTANISADIASAVFSFNTAQQVEYIRIYNSRHVSHDADSISSVKITVEDASSNTYEFVVGHAVEWNGAGGAGGCTDAKYPCFVDMVHNAKQTACVRKCGNPSNQPYEVDWRPHDQYTCADVKEGEPCRLRCKLNYGGYVPNVAEATCQSDGTYANAPDCEPIQCDVPTFDNATSAACTETTYGSLHNCEYNCEENGFETPTFNTLTCGDNHEFKAKHNIIFISVDSNNDYVFYEGSSRRYRLQPPNIDSNFYMTSVSNDQCPYDATSFNERWQYHNGYCRPGTYVATNPTHVTLEDYTHVKPVLRLVAGYTYTFVYGSGVSADDTNGHPLCIGEWNSTSCNPATGFTLDASTHTATFTVPSGATNLKYGCTRHAGMGNDIIVHEKFCEPKKCTELPVVPAGAFSTCDSDMINDNTCKVYCGDDYVESFIDYTCQNGQFSPQLTLNDCVLKTCSTASLPSDGVTGHYEHSCGDSVDIHQSCSLTCSESYTGSPSVYTCQSDGSFSGPGEPTCTSVTNACSNNPTPSDPSVETFDCTSNNDDGNVCQALCNTGYSGTGSNSTCNDGVWSNLIDGSCTKVTCSVDTMPSVSHTANTCDGKASVNYSDVCTLSCDTTAGYEEAMSDYTCLETGNMDGNTEFSCSLVTCSPDPTAKPNEKAITCSQNVYGNACNAECKDDHTGTGTSYQCGTNGWDITQQGTCQPKCTVTPHSDATTNCTVDGQVAYGESCSYQCTSGSLSTHIVSCEANGVFEASFDCSFQCENGGISHPNKDACKCPKGFFGLKCGQLFASDDTFDDNKPLLERRRLSRVMTGPMDRNLDENQFITPENRLIKLHKDGNNIPPFNVYSLDKPQAGFDVLFPLKSFKSILRFETEGADDWQLGEGDAPLRVFFDNDLASERPVSGFFYNDTTGELEMLDTVRDGAEAWFEIRHFSEYGTVEVEPVCGSGVVEQFANGTLEACDDGNLNPNDGCSASCTVEIGYQCSNLQGSQSTCNTVCGDQLRVGGEQCDNGNADGCDNCTIANEYYCTGGSSTTADTCSECSESTCGFDEYLASCGVYQSGTCTACATAVDDQTYYSTHGTFGDATSGCPTTTCDAGSCASGEFLDGCGGLTAGSCSLCTSTSSDAGAHFTSRGTAGNPGSCTVESYNDGQITSGPSISDPNVTITEVCDDGNTNTGDGCHNGAVEYGWSCIGEPSTCDPICGNGEMHGNEECDNGNEPGCDNTACTIQRGFTCTGQGSGSCNNTECGDGVRAVGKEECDDGNTITGDGCSKCKVDASFSCTHSIVDGVSDTCVQIDYTIDPTTGCLKIDRQPGTYNAGVNGEAKDAFFRNQDVNLGNRSSDGRHCYICTNDDVIFTGFNENGAKYATVEELPSIINCVLENPYIPPTVCKASVTGDLRMQGSEECDFGGADACDGSGAIDNSKNVFAQTETGVVAGSDGIVTHDEQCDTNVDAEWTSPDCKCEQTNNTNPSQTQQSLGCPMYDGFEFRIKQNGRVGTTFNPVDDIISFDIFTNQYVVSDDPNIILRIYDGSQNVPTLLRQADHTHVLEWDDVDTFYVTEYTDTKTLEQMINEAVPSNFDGVSACNQTYTGATCSIAKTEFTPVSDGYQIDLLATYNMLQRSSAVAVRMYVKVNRIGNLYGLMVSQRSRGSVKFGIPRPFVFNVGPRFVATDFSAITASSLVGDTVNEAQGDQTLSTQYQYTVQRTGRSYLDAHIVPSIAYASVNGDDWDAVSRVYDVPGNSIVATYPGVTVSGTYQHLLLDDGQQTIKFNSTVPAYANSVRYNGKYKLTLSVTYTVCDTGNTFTKSSDGADIGVQAVIYDAPKASVTVPSNVNENENYDVTVSWTKSASDISTVQSWDSFTCCSDATDNFNFPGLSVNTASYSGSVVDKCITIQPSSSDETYVNRNTAFTNGISFAVDMCDRATQPLSFTCDVEVVEKRFITSSISNLFDATTSAGTAVGPVTVVASVTDLNKSTTFTSDFELLAGTDDVTFEVCTFVHDNTLTSGCNHNEAVSLNKIEYDVGHDSLKENLDQSLFVNDHGAWVGDSNTFYFENTAPGCLTFIIDPAVNQATCGTADRLKLTATHQVSELGVDYIENSVAYVKIKPQVTALSITSSDFYGVEEDTVPLKEHFSWDRAAAGSKTEQIVSVTLSTEHLDKAKISLVDVSNNELGDFATGSVVVPSAQYEGYDTVDNFQQAQKTFVEGLKLKFEEDFNTDFSTPVDIKVTIVVTECDGLTQASSDASINIVLTRQPDACSATVSSVDVSRSAGSWDALFIDAIVDNEDEKANFEVTLTSNVAIDTIIDRTLNQIDGDVTNVNVSRTITLTCGDDNSNPAHWEALSDGRFRCLKLKDLYIRPSPKDAEYPVNSFKFDGCAHSGGGSFVFGKCTSESLDNYVETSHSFYPWAPGVVFVKVLSSVESNGIKQACTMTDNLQARFWVFRTIVGEIVNLENNVKVYDATNDAAVESNTIPNVLSTLNNGGIELTLTRQIHSIWYKIDNGLVLTLSIESNNCVDTFTNTAVGLELQGLTNSDQLSWPVVTTQDYVSDKTVTIVRSDSNNYVTSNCSVRIKAATNNDVFAPVYAPNGFFDYNIQASLGEATIEAPARQAITTNFNIIVKRENGQDGLFTVAIGVNSNCGGSTPSLSETSVTFANGDTDDKTVSLVAPGAGNCELQFTVDGVQKAVTEITGDLGSQTLTADSYVGVLGLRKFYKSTGVDLTLSRDTPGHAYDVKLSVKSTSTCNSIELHYNTTSSSTDVTVVFLANTVLDQTVSVSAVDAETGCKIVINKQIITGTIGASIEIASFTAEDDYSDGATDPCKFGKMQSATANRVPVQATLYSAYVSHYIELTEGAADSLDPNDVDSVTYTVTPVYSDVKMRVRLATRNVYDAPPVDAFNSPFVDVEGPTELTLTLTQDDAISAAQSLSFVYVEYAVEPPTEFSQPTGYNATRLNEACRNLQHEPGFGLDYSSIANVNSQYSGRRLMSLVNNREIGAIIKYDDDIHLEHYDKQPNEANAYYWSNSTLDGWNEQLQVTMKFDVPIYGTLNTIISESQHYYGAYATLGKCPTVASDLFSQPAEACNTLTTQLSSGTDIEILRDLVGLSAGSTSYPNCSKDLFPCPERYVQDPAWSHGFGLNRTGVAPTGTSLVSGNLLLPAYTYTYKDTITNLLKCKYKREDATSNVVTRSLSSEGTTYSFDTCVVTYGPRLHEAINSSIIVHGAQRRVSLTSVSDGIVTAVMFDVAEDIRVTVEARQESCSESECLADNGASYGMEYACSDKYSVQLKVIVTVDVLFDADNTYKYSGIYDGTDILKGALGCHWNATLQKESATVQQITLDEDRSSGISGTYTYTRTTMEFITPCMSAEKPNGDVISDVFSTCNAVGKEGPNYNMQVFMGSCKSLSELQDCTVNGNCNSNCLKTGSSQERTELQISVVLDEKPPNYQDSLETSIQLKAGLFKYDSVDEVKLSEGHTFGVEDTLVFAVAPGNPSAFESSNFGITCPDKYLGAYSGVGDRCTTSAAQEWTYTIPAPDVTQCTVGQPCAECNKTDSSTYSHFPQGLKAQSVYFDRATSVHICASDFTALAVYSVVKGDLAIQYWEIFYQRDARARPSSENGGLCTQGVNCRQLCYKDASTQAALMAEQVKQNCDTCRLNLHYQYVLPIATALHIVKNGTVTTVTNSFTDVSTMDVKVCKPRDTSNKQAHNPDTVCVGAQASTPRTCVDFPNLPVDTFGINSQISSATSIYMGGLRPNTMYSLSAHCYITDCSASYGGARRLLAEVDPTDPHTPAVGSKLFHIQGDTTATDATDSDVIGLGSTIAITLGVVALVVIGLMSVSWIYLYRRAYGPTTALPTTMPVQQQQQRQPLLYQSSAQSGWNF